MTDTVDEVSDQLKRIYQAKLPEPHPVYHHLRSADPVHFSDFIGAWILTRYDDVRAAANDPGFSSARAHYYMDQLPATARERLRPLGHQLALWLIHMDPPDHTRVRALVHKAFVPQVVESLRESIHQIVNDLLDGVAESGSMDVMDEFA